MKNVWMVIGLTILMVVGALGQVHIKEGVVITPEQVKRIKSGGNNPHRFHIEISASPEDKTSMWITGPCLDSTFWFQGSMDINSPPAGSYGFNYAGFYWTGEIPYPSGAHDNVSISIYFDDSLLVATSSSTICFSYPYNNPQYPESLLRYFSYPVLCGFSTPYISAFKLSILDPAKIFGNPFREGAPFNPDGAWGGSAGLDVSGVNDCSGTLWLPESDIITVSIVQGSQFVSFHRGEPHTPQEVNLGSVATVVGGAGGVYLVPDGIDADSLGDWIVVRAESGNISSQDTVFLEPSYWHFYNPGPEDVEHMGEARINLDPVNVYDHYIEIPDSTHLDISLDSAGMKYGSLQIGDSIGKVFKNVPWGSLPQWDEYVTYVADGAISLQPIDAHVHVTVAYQDIPPLDMALHVIPQPVSVTCAPAVLSPGDTATITVKQLLTDGSLTDFSPDQQFEIGLSRGENYGAILLSDEETGGYFSYVSQPFKFIAADSIDADSVVVRIRVGTKAPILFSTVPGEKGTGGTNKKNLSHKSPQNNSSSKRMLPQEAKAIVRGSIVQNFSAVPSTKSGTSSEKGNGKSIADENQFFWSDFGIGEVVIAKHSILLGETKYYQAVKDPHAGDRILFREFKKTSDIGAQELSSVDFGVSIVEGDKPSMYWEKKDEQGDPLRSDIIRLVGRYWEDGKTYKVKLTANAEGRTGSIQIEVKKPAKLGDSHPSVTDVFGNSLNLDELIIKYAGEYGIPPQIIKGQMEQECSSFSPAWRYEPFQDVSIQTSPDLNQRYFGSNLPFVVDETTMGTGDKPASHSNEDPLPYLGTPAKIADYTVAHWGNYVQHHTGDKPDIIVGSAPLSDHWTDLYQEIKDENGDEISDEEARAQAHDGLQQEIQDVTSDLGKSFDHNAQTRKVTSYGFVQMMYITATDNKFNNNHDKCKDLSTIHYVDQTDVHTYPEKLNEQDFLMPRYSDLLWQKLNSVFTGCIPDGEWQGGFEAAWEKALNRYHGGKPQDTYGRSVLTNAKSYQPAN